MFGPIMDGMYNTRLEFLFDGSIRDGCFIFI